MLMYTDERLEEGVILNKRYKIKRLIKAGGMGAVYEAVDERLKSSPCAVKEMLSPPEENTRECEYMIKRFKEEAKMLHELRHPNLPVVRDYFFEKGRYYLVMDYIGGKDLNTVANKYDNGVPEGLVIKWSIKVLEALDYLHHQSPPIVYRDVKPSNIMLKNSGEEIVLVDFGLARPVRPESQSLKTLVGTPAYVPEEILHGRPEPASDIYSLGATMHHLLTGEIATKFFAFRPVREIMPSVSKELEEVVMKALERKVKDRYKNALEMKGALEKIPPVKETDDYSHYFNTEIPLNISKKKPGELSEDTEPTLSPEIFPETEIPGIEKNESKKLSKNTQPVLPPEILPGKEVKINLKNTIITIVLIFMGIFLTATIMSVIAGTSMIGIFFHDALKTRPTPLSGQPDSDLMDISFINKSNYGIKLIVLYHRNGEWMMTDFITLLPDEGKKIYTDKPEIHYYAEGPGWMTDNPDRENAEKIKLRNDYVYLIPVLVKEKEVIFERN